MTPLVQGSALKALEETVATVVAFDGLTATRIVNCFHVSSSLVTQHLLIIIELEGGQKWRIVPTTIGLGPNLAFLRSQIVHFYAERLILFRDAR